MYLMEAGTVEANILRLNERYKLPYIEPLIAEKRSGVERSELPAGHGLDFYTREYERLMARLIELAGSSRLPAVPHESAKSRLNDLLLRLRGVGTKPEIALH